MAAVLVPLFIAYGAAHAVARELETVGFHVAQMCTQEADGPVLSTSKVEERVAEVERRVSELGVAVEYERVRARIAASVPEEPRSALRVVSGKNYLLPLLNFHLRRTVGFRGSIEELKVRLARHAFVGIDPDLSDAVRKASRAFLL